MTSWWGISYSLHFSKTRDTGPPKRLWLCLLEPHRKIRFFSSSQEQPFKDRKTMITFSPEIPNPAPSTPQSTRFQGPSPSHLLYICPGLAHVALTVPSAFCCSPTTDSSLRACETAVCHIFISISCSVSLWARPFFRHYIIPLLAGSLVHPTLHRPGEAKFCPALVLRF